MRVIVVTTENPVATMDAAWKAASAMPSTGPDSASRAASSPGSPKQAITVASKPSRAASIACSATPAAPKASSRCPSIDTGPNVGQRATISVPGAATALAASAMLRVIGSDVLGLIRSSFIGAPCTYRVPCARNWCDVQ